MKNKFVKKDVYDELVKKVNAIQTNDTSNLVKKLTVTEKLVTLRAKMSNHNHGGYFTIAEFNKF